MIEARGDLWTFGGANVDARVVTTNGVLDRHGRLVMGAGCALEARGKWPWLPAILGDKVKANGNVAYCTEVGEPWQLVSFPTKHDWCDPSDILLIGASAHRLARMADHFGWQRVVMPRPGCGKGGLTWTYVSYILGVILDDRFTVVTHAKTGERAA